MQQLQAERGDDHDDQRGNRAVSSQRNPRTCIARMRKDATAVSAAEIHSDRPNTSRSPSAAPTNSARSVAIATASACSHSSHTAQRGSRSRHTCGRLRPVAMPSLALIDWMSIAIRFAVSTTHSSV